MGRDGKFVGPAILLAGCIAATGILVACQGSSSTASVQAADDEDVALFEVDATPVAWGEMENFLRVSDRIYSGGEPHEGSFDALRRLGVKTVVSVDGATPNVEAARAAGIRYVHIPIGYDGVTDESAAAMREALKETDGAVFVHCHHGKHRGPAMAAVALQLDGAGDPEAGEALLARSGTSPKYAGLWRDVKFFNPARCEGLEVTLYEQAPVDSMVAHMAAVGRSWDRIKYSRDAGWGAPPDHPDVDPPHEALLLMEAFRESARWHEATPGDYMARQPGGEAEFARWMRQSESDAVALRAALLRGDHEAANVAYDNIGMGCADCHAAYRN